MIQLDSTTSTTFGVHLDGYISGDVTLTFTNQLTNLVTTPLVTPNSSNGRATQFSFEPTAYIEGMYLVVFTQGATILATRLCYVTNGSTPLSESTFTSYTTGDNTPASVYIVE